MRFMVSTLHSKFDAEMSNVSVATAMVGVQGQYRYGRECGFACCFGLKSIGLSKSRNALLNMAAFEEHLGPWLICDDDVVYRDADLIEGEVAEWAEKYPADIYILRVSDGNDNDFKKYKPARVLTTLSDIAGVSSIEMLIANSEVLASVRFDERFGLGATYPYGCEELIFLADALRKGFSICAIPVYVGSHPVDSTGHRDDCVEYWQTRRAAFKIVLGRFWLAAYTRALVRRLAGRRWHAMSYAIRGLMYK